jgi:hypothetical protein
MFYFDLKKMKSDHSKYYQPVIVITFFQGKNILFFLKNQKVTIFLKKVSQNILIWLPRAPSCPLCPLPDAHDWCWKLSVLESEVPLGVQYQYFLSLPEHQNKSWGFIPGCWRFSRTVPGFRNATTFTVNLILQL